VVVHNALPLDDISTVEKIPGAIIPGIPGGNIKEIRGRFHLTKIPRVPRDAKETYPYKQAKNPKNCDFEAVKE
jgi:hypothetical protein